MKNIAVVYPFDTGEKAFSGGVPKVVVSNLIAIHKNGHKPFLILPIGNKGLIRYVENEHPYCAIVPVKFSCLSLYSDTKGFNRYVNISRNFIGFLSGRKRLKKALNEISPELIHYHEVVNFLFLDLYEKAKVILHLHSYRFTGYGRTINYIMKKVNRNADLLLSPTNSILEALGEKIHTKSLQLNTPYLELEAPNKVGEIDTRFSDLEAMRASGKIIFSFVGRICSIKRIDHFIEALINISPDLKNKTVFVIVGGVNTDGDRQYQDFLKKKIRKHKLGENVKFLGYVNPIESLLPHIDYGVILSESEAVPMIGIEYMRYRIPIIAYKAPGITDFMIDRKNGFLVNNGDKKDLVSCLEMAIDLDDSTIKDFQQLIEEIYRKYTLEEFTKSLNEIYERTIKD